MATDSERLLVTIEARLSQFQREMAKASGTANRTARTIETRFRRMESNLAASSLRVGRGLAAPLLALGSASTLGNAADSFTRIQNSLRVAGLEGEEAASVLSKLFDVAQKNGAPIESLAQLYSRLALSQRELGVSSDELIRFSEGISAALKVSGTDATSASGALLQLSQAVSGGVVRAEEFNSMLEGGLQPALQAVANGMVEAGGSVAKLRQLVIDGKVSSEAFFRAFRAGQGDLEGLASTADSTIGQAFSRLRNTITLSIGKLDDGVDASGRLSDAMDGVGEAIEGVIGWLIRMEAPLDRAGNKIAEIFDTVRREARQAGRTLGAQKLGEGIGATDAINNQIRDVFDTVDAQFVTTSEELTAALRRRAAQRGGELFAGPPKFPGKEADNRILLEAPPPKVSIDDHPVLGGGSMSSRKTPAQNFQADIDRIRERTEALRIETDMVGRSTFERERAVTIMDLENEARRAGVTLTPQMIANIHQEADAYARAAQSMEAVEQRYAEMQAAQQFVGDQISGLFSDIVTGGTSAQEALGRLAAAFAEAALQAALLGQGPLAGLFGGGSASGGVGGLLGRIFGGGKANGGTVVPGRIYPVGERGPELFSPSVAGRVHPNGRGGGVVVHFAPVTNVASGATAAEVRAAIAQSHQQFRRELPSLIKYQRAHGSL